MPAHSEEHLDLIILGRVQGVGFRWWTRARAEALDLRGTVRNRPDGAVEVHAAGPADRIGRFRNLLADGPAGAEVMAIEDAPSPGTNLPERGFRILR